jgi:hypothetical protein
MGRLEGISRELISRYYLLLSHIPQNIQQICFFGKFTQFHKDFRCYAFRRFHIAIVLLFFLVNLGVITRIVRCGYRRRYLLLSKVFRSNLVQYLRIQQ